MDYNFYNFNPKDFEHLVQSLMQKTLGNLSLVFGEGRDGARELTYNGSAIFDKEKWNGYWVVQAKFKSKADSMDDDYEWIKKNYDAEIKKFRDKKRQLKVPQNYILVTNASLSAVADVGGIDKMGKYIERDKDIINNIVIIYYDSLCRLLDNNRDVATSYASFILPGDILQELYRYNNNNRSRALSLFLMKEFKNELHAKLIQAGDLNNNNINIEKVFIDLHATENGIVTEEDSKFIRNLILAGNESLKNRRHKVVLIGSAGAGKSTLSQFAVQLYSAYFLKREQNDYPEINQFLTNYNQEEIPQPLCCRFPVKIVLKEYAEWISKKSKDDESMSVLFYISHLISKCSDITFLAADLRNILSKLSFLFIFDGLDEVPSTSNRDLLIKEINSFIDIDLFESKCDALIVATTRPQGFSNEFSSDKFKHLKVCELTDDTCIHYLNRLLSQIESSEKERERLISILKKALEDATIGRLMRTPLQATIMTILVESSGEPSNNRFRLFNDYYDTILKREKQKGIYKILNTHNRIISDIHFKLAYNLQTSSENTQNPSAYISIQDFRDFIEKILKAEGFDEKEIRLLSDDICANVTERLVFISEIQDQKVGFVIRSMQEFFAARYFLSLNDDEIKTVLENISKNIYWRNTLLFLIGGLHIENRRTLVDSVIALCHKMNGEDCSSNEKNSNKILRLGSWLAMDILIEGSFSDSPKNENMFIALLKPVFDMPPTNSLEKFQDLPERIVKERIINDFIKTGIEQNYETAVSLIAYLSINNIYDKEIYDSCFTGLSTNKEQEFYLIHALRKISPDSLLFKNALEDSLIKYEVDEIYDFFIPIEENAEQIAYNWLNRACYKHKLLEIYFLLFLQFNRYYRNWGLDYLGMIFELINLKILEEFERFNQLFINEWREKINNWYSKIYYIPRKQSKEGRTLIEDLMASYKGISTNYIFDYWSFYNSFSKEGVKKLFLSMFNRVKRIFSIFINSPVQIWYVKEIIKELPDFENLSESIISKIIDSSEYIIDAQAIQAKSDHLKSVFHWVIGGGYSDENFEEIYYIVRKNNSERTACKELVMAFEGIDNSPAFINGDTKERITFALLCPELSANLYRIEAIWVFFSHYLTINELDNMIEKSTFNNFSKDPEKILRKGKYYFHRNYFDNSVMNRVYFKLSQKTSNFVSTQKQNIMTKEEYLSLAASRYEALEKLKEHDNFYDYEKNFDAIWTDLGRLYMESQLNETSKTKDRRKKKL